MARVFEEKIVEAPVAQVWESWNDFANIVDFNPGLSNSFLLEGSEETGLGAERQCDFSDGKTSIKERIVAYEPEQRLKIEIFDGNAPIKDAGAEIRLYPLGDTRTRVTMELTFEPTMGVVGKLLVPMMRRQFAKAVSGLLAGNATHVENGKVAAAA